MTLDVQPGCEPFAHDGGDHGVLVLHGFTGNPTTMRPLAQRLADAGFTVSLPRLAGHGTTVEDMMTTSWDDWFADALAAYDDLASRCTRVSVVGLSMGGGLAVAVAQHRGDVTSLVLINPLVTPPGAEMEEGLAQLLEAGLETIDGIGSDVKREGIKESAYALTPLACAGSLFAATHEIEAALADVSAPTLLLNSREDHVVPSSNGDAIVAHFTGPVERVWLEDSYHVATIDNDRELVEARTVAFLAGGGDRE